MAETSFSERFAASIVQALGVIWALVIAISFAVSQAPLDHPA
jgi:hypothetical protein